MRIGIDPARRVSDTHSIKQFNDPLPCGGAIHLPMQSQRFGDLLANRVQGVKRGHWLLKDKANPITAQRRQLRLGQADQ